MPASMTYNSLVSDVQTYLERDDAAFVTEIPRFIMYAEQKIAAALKIFGQQLVVTGTMVTGNPVIPKPSRWRDTVSINVLNGTTRSQVFERGYEFCRTYNPDPTTTGLPKYYADYNSDNIFLSPTPSTGYTFEMVYMARIDPLDVNNQTNWFTVNAPQLMLYATMVEAAQWLKNDDRTAYWQALLTQEMKSLTDEDAKRIGDRNVMIRE